MPEAPRLKQEYMVVRIEIDHAECRKLISENLSRLKAGSVTS
jgi:hypothetical protein